MKVVLLPAPYTPERAAAGLAFGRAAPPSLLVPGGVIVPPDPLPPAPEGQAAAVLPVVRMDRYIMSDGRLHMFALARAVCRAAAKAGDGGLAVDVTSPAFGVLGDHGNRAAEMSRVVARTFYWEPVRPVVVQFCYPPELPFHVREWLRLLSGEPQETVREHVLADPGHRLRFHLGHAHAERDRHHPWVRIKRTARERFGRTVNRFKFWRWFR